MKILCKIFGHKMINPKDGSSKCKRCKCLFFSKDYFKYGFFERIGFDSHTDYIYILPTITISKVVSYEYSISFRWLIYSIRIESNSSVPF